ncbi:MAG: Protein FecR [Pseudomonas sp.]|nr:MAG: Protein FecR [Pseudomonas sp.]
MRSEKVTYQELNAFAHWREDPLNAHAYRNAETLWQLLKQPVHPPPRMPLARRGVYALAACLALGASWAVLMAPPVDTWGSDYATPAGQRQDITLADGTRLEMDSDSALDVILTADERQVRLLRGRVFLNVAHDGRPFLVNAGATQVRVWGTAFSVAHEPARDEVVLLCGSVEVASAGQHQHLQPGEALQVVNGQVQAPQTADTEHLLAWRSGHLWVQNAPLRDVLEQVMRYQGGHVIWLDSKVGRRLVSASLNLDDIDSAVSLLVNSQKLRTTALTHRVLIVQGG